MTENNINHDFININDDTPIRKDITLEFDLESKDSKSSEVVQAPVDEEYVVDKEFLINTLNEEEKEIVLNFVDKIDLTKTNSLLAYGQKTQKNIDIMSEKMLGEVRTKDTGAVGDTISKLVGELKGIEEIEDDKGFLGIFKSKNLKNRVENYKIKYQSIEKNIDAIVNEMDTHKIKLIGDIHNLDNLYQINKEYFKELTLYIVAGEEKLKTFYNTDIAEKRKEVAESSSQIHAQELQDMLNQATRFEKKLHDLKLSRVVCIQFAPQIRLIQNNDSELLQKIQSTITNSIPIWRSNIIIGMGLENSKKALEAQKSVTDMTNNLLKQNSELLKQGSLDIARETERGIIDVETIQTINNNLISTLTEVVEIQKQGIEKRKNIESELYRIETDLKNKIISTADERIKLR